MSNQISRRSFIAGAVSGLIVSVVGGFKSMAAAFTYNTILGRPSKNSIAVSVLSQSSGVAYVEYGTSGKTFPSKSAQLQIQPGNPTVFELKNLRPNQKYFYRVRSKQASEKTFAMSKNYFFQTQRSLNKGFTFSLHGDTHPERAGKMFNVDLYKVTLANIASQNNDFHILMGDDFSIDPIIAKRQATKENVEKIYQTHREWLSALGATTPIFLVNGNHEQAAQYLLDGSTSNPAVLAGNARNKFFPQPAPDGFYTGDELEVPGIGKLRDYFAWNWGDALLITLDPYWHSKYAVDNVAGVTTEENSTNKKSGSGAQKVNDLWQVGIGDAQYAWFKKTLEDSNAKYIFVFTHHVMGTGRGGVEVSTNYEWGGKDPKGVTTFKEQRPNWELPIHDLMVKHKVSIFFQGHDHIFVTQERDGLIYQSMPNPADGTFSMFNDSAYKSGTKAPNSGHVRVSVNPEVAKVEYFLSARSSDVSRKNMTVAHSYEVNPRSI